MSKKKRLKIRLVILFIILSFLSTSLLGYFDISIGDAVVDFANVDAHMIIADYINGIVYEYLSNNRVNYFELVKLEKSDNGKVTAVMVDSVKLNLIKSEISKEIIDKFSELEKREYGIPLGTVMKSRLFSGRGPDIKVKIIPLGAFTSSIDNKFVSVGINQSMHSIYLNFNAMIKITAPFSEASVSVTDTICLTETVLLGDVPNTYVEIKGGDGRDYLKYFSGN
ncbi:MAG: sporulation protein YunB [Eubacteriales bacterium]|nr:sporulation protein YunB [Eubacteriales bacterium]